MASSYLWLEALGNGRKWELGLVYEEPLYNAKKFGFYPEINRVVMILNQESNIYGQILILETLFVCYSRFGERKKEETEKEKGPSMWGLKRVWLVDSHVKCHGSII